MPDYYLRKRFSKSKISIILRTLQFFKKNCYMTHMNTKRRYFLRVPQNNGSGDKDKVKDFDSVRPVR